MPLPERGIAGASVARWAGLLLIGVSMVLMSPLGDAAPVRPGMTLFLAWAAFCVAAVLARRMVLWALLALVPLCTIAWMFWMDWTFVVGEPDPLRFYPWNAMALFVGVSLVVTLTGILSLAVAARERAKP